VGLEYLQRRRLHNLPGSWSASAQKRLLLIWVPALHSSFLSFLSCSPLVQKHKTWRQMEGEGAGKGMRRVCVSWGKWEFRQNALSEQERWKLPVVTRSWILHLSQDSAMSCPALWVALPYGGLVGEGWLVDHEVLGSSRKPFGKGYLVRANRDHTKEQGRVRV